MTPTRENVVTAFWIALVVLILLACSGNGGCRISVQQQHKIVSDKTRQKE